jgi:hypothetical protein
MEGFPMDRLKRFYEILETPFGASLEEVQQKYRDLAVVWHPDRFAHNPRLQAAALEKLKEINGAYHELTAYLKQHGPPSPSSLNRGKKENPEKADREKERAAREARAQAEARTAREKTVTPMGTKPLPRVLVGTALLLGCLAAGYLFIPEKKGIPVADGPPAGIVSPSREDRSSSGAEPHSGKALKAPSSPVQTPHPTQALSSPSPPGQITRRAEEAASRQRKQEPPLPVRSRPVPDSGVGSVPQQAFERCRAHSPAEWCDRIVERCREYLRECRKLSQSDSSYRESAECRGVHEWCYEDPRRVIHVGTDEEEQGDEGTE